MYARLAAEAQKKLEEDNEIRPYYFKQGMTFVYNGQPGRFRNIWETGLENTRNAHNPSSLVEMHTPEEVFARIHGNQSKVVTDDSLKRPRQ